MCPAARILALLTVLYFLATTTTAKAIKPPESAKKKYRIIPGKAIPTKPGVDPSKIRHPMKLEFFMRASGLEKMFYDENDVKEQIQKHSHVGPGHGPPEIFVKDSPGGYRCRVEWPDSTHEITDKQALGVIHDIDYRLLGRVSQVKVKRY